MKNKKLNIFKYICAISVITYITLLFNEPTGTQLMVFYGETTDFFADFFNCMRLVADKDPYNSLALAPGDRIYLPFSYLILYPFSRFCNYSNLTLNECYTQTPALISCLLFSLITISIYIHAIILLLKKYRVSFLFIIPIICSSIFLYSIERGTLVFVSASCIIYYILYHNSKNIILSYFAIICLCIATTLKIYPALFGILLLKNKSYKKILFCILLTSLLVLLPFLFFKGGFNNLIILFNNFQESIALYSPNRIYERYSISHLTYLFCNFLNISNSVIQISISIIKYIIIFISILSLYLSLCTKKYYNSLFLILCVLLYLPANSGLYCGLYIIPIIIIYLSIPSSQISLSVLIAFGIILMPIQIRYVNISITYLLSNICLLYLWGYFIQNTLFSLLNNKK